MMPFHVRILEVTSLTCTSLHIQVLQTQVPRSGEVHVTLLAPTLTARKYNLIYNCKRNSTMLNKNYKKAKPIRRSIVNGYMQPKS